MPELRKDPIVNRWVIISSERGNRPKDFSTPEKKTNKESCPFCEGSEPLTPPEILAYRRNSPNSPGWTLRVVPNKYPALTDEGETGQMTEGLYDKINGIGTHEVLIESPDHDTELELLPKTQIADSLKALQERVLALKENKRFHYIMIFKNRGEPSGASLEHTHTQLIALPIVPELVSEELAGGKKHYDKNERCIYCDLIAQELEDGRRIVCQNENFITIVPFAPRFPFEMWILPRLHSARFEECETRLFDALASSLKESLLRMRTALNAPSYNFVFHTAPVNGNHFNYYHWHIEIMPKLTKMAGFEQGTGFYINPTVPEEAAEILRETRL
jgi:UDPglucose--hexose-1-phosphate uridylyltransferase